MNDNIICSIFDHGTVTEDKPRIITKVIEGTCSDSKYTFTLAGRLSEPSHLDSHTVTLSSPPTNLTCILDYIIEVALPGFIEKRRLRNLEDIDAFIIKITCTIPFPLNDTNIIVSEVKGTFRTEDDPEVFSYDLSNIEQINNKITCLKEEETEPENNDNTQNENEEENQSGDNDDSQNGDNDDTKSGDNEDTKNGDNDDSQSGSESNKEEDSGKIIQLSCYLFMFILFVF